MERIAPPMNKTQEPLYLKPREVAKLLNLSATTVYTLCLSGELPSIRIGGFGTDQCRGISGLVSGTRAKAT